jgi:hypothetical protein
MAQRLMNSIAKRAAMIYSSCRLCFARREHTPGVLFVSYAFLSKGGVEKRVRQYAPVWRKRGYKTYIAARRGGGSLSEIDLLLTASLRYNERLLLWFIKKKNIRAVEWQAGGCGGPPFDPAHLKKYGVRFGVAVHASRAGWNFDYLRQAGYVLCASAVHGRRVPLLQFAPVLPNALAYKPAVWKFGGQQTAVFISRLAADKVPSFEAFIELCRKGNIPFELAGGLVGKEAHAVKRALQQKYALADKVFIGEVDTQEFLTRQAKRYLFVGGVGQVILEAGQLGYPCVVCSVRGRGFAFFARRENFKQLAENNCSPRLEHETALFAADIRRVRKDLRQVRSGSTARFLLAREINQSCALRPELEKYERIILAGNEK